jgi:Dolichyl-phosphate-mannose-protein mannosyltransferase
MNSWSRFPFPRALLVCFAIIAAALAATSPYVEMSVNDDFAYTRVAQLAAETGRLIYKGWGSPIVGIQAYWAALFIKIFGFSFQIVRLSAIPFTFGVTAILLSLFKRAGLPPATAIFATLAIPLSPVAIPLETTFMTDIPSFFFVLLCIWCAVRAIDSPTDQALLRWALLTVAAGLAGASIRQTVGLTLVICLPFIAWQARRRSLTVLVLGMLAAAIGLVAALNFWYQVQPYAVPLPLIDKANFKGYRIAAFVSLSNILQLFLTPLPVLVLALSFWRKSSSDRASKILLSLCAFAGVFAGSFLFYVWRSRPYLPKIPFAHPGGNMVTQWGFLGQDVEIMGRKPIILPDWLQSSLVMLSVALALAAAVALYRSILRGSLLPKWKSAEWKVFIRANSVLILLGLYAFSYLPLVMLRAYVGVAFDRYLIPFLAPLILALCLLPGVRLRPPHAIAWLTLAAGAFLGVAISHDYFSQSRARLEAAQMLQRSGIPRNHISAGFEYDMWSQMEFGDYINDPMIISPPHAFVPVDPLRYPSRRPFWVWGYTPSLSPQYIEVLSPQPELQNTLFPPVVFKRWLAPPGHVLIQTGGAPPLH